jgi:legumain
MKFVLVFAIAIFTIIHTTNAAHHAVLIAGSHGYQNYRHHADICHSYNILIKQGIPKSNIILMMYNDVANSWQNPFKGKLFNKPTDSNTPGVDVYANCKDNIDYEQRDVNADNFIAVITGDKDKVQGGNGRVLNSTSTDRVFIYFADHGGTGLIAMPNPPYLHADDLNKALNKMSNNQMFKELTFYVEACESGSMFEQYSDDLKKLNIYITTAANPSESSWGTYCPPQDKVNGKDMHTCLGDLYSVNWMENADTADLKTETLQKQFEIVKNETIKSHVQQYGTTDFTNEPCANFEGDEDLNPPAVKSQQQLLLRKKKSSSSIEVTLIPRNDADEDMAITNALAGMVDSRDINIVRLFHKYMKTGKDGKELIKEIQSRESSNEIFKQLIVNLYGSNDENIAKKMYETHAYKPTKYDCHREIIKIYNEQCPEQFTDYSLKHTKVIVNLCEDLNGNVEKIGNALRKVCQ